MRVREDELVCLAGDFWLRLEIYDTGIVTWMFPATTLQSQGGSLYLRTRRDFATKMFDCHQHSNWGSIPEALTRTRSR